MKNIKSLSSKWQQMPKNQLYQWLLLIVVVIGLGWLIINRINQDNRESYGLQSDASGLTPTVNFVYLIPSDQEFIPKYEKSITTAAKRLGLWYSDQLFNGRGSRSAFKYNVMHKTLPHPASYYQGTGATWDYYVRTLEDGFALTGGSYDDPNNRWIYINAALIGEGQGAGGTNGVAVLHGTDLIGLASNKPNRYVGGLGHELGHAFTLPHPSDCPTALHCATDLMYLGYSIFPTNVTLTEEDKYTLLKSPQVAQFFDNSIRRNNKSRAQNEIAPNRNPSAYLPVSEKDLK